MESEIIENAELMKLAEVVQRFNLCGNDLIERIHSSEKYVEVTDRFYYTIVFKLHNILSTLDYFIMNLDNKPGFVITTMLALRTCMLDLINLYFVLDIISQPAEVEDRINWIMADHLVNVWNELSPEHKTEIKRDWPQLFDKNGERKKFDRGNLTIKKMCDDVKKSPILMLYTPKVLHLYKLFSKVEHNGAFSFDLLHNPFSTKWREIGHSLVTDAVVFTMNGIKLVSENWIETTDNLYQKMDALNEQATDFFLSIKPE